MSISRLPKNRPKIAKDNLGYWQKIEPKIFEFGLVCDLSWPVESGNFFLAHPVYFDKREKCPVPSTRFSLACVQTLLAEEDGRKGEKVKSAQ